jgi:cell division protein FtsB
MGQRKSHASFGKEVYYIFCVVIFIVSAVLSVFGPGGYKEMRASQRELAVHRARVEALRQANKQRVATIEGLRSDKAALEKYAREKGYARPNEIIQQLPPEPAGTAREPSRR